MRRREEAPAGARRCRTRVSGRAVVPRRPLVVVVLMINEGRRVIQQVGCAIDQKVPHRSASASGPEPAVTIPWWSTRRQCNSKPGQAATTRTLVRPPLKMREPVARWPTGPGRGQGRGAASRQSAVLSQQAGAAEGVRAKHQRGAAKFRGSGLDSRPESMANFRRREIFRMVELRPSG